MAGLHGIICGACGYDAKSLTDAAEHWTVKHGEAIVPKRVHWIISVEGTSDHVSLCGKLNPILYFTPAPGLEVCEDCVQTARYVDGVFNA